MLKDKIHTQAQQKLENYYAKKQWGVLFFWRLEHDPNHTHFMVLVVGKGKDREQHFIRVFMSDGRWQLAIDRKLKM